jgi:hypothetical protein
VSYFTVGPRSYLRKAPGGGVQGAGKSEEKLTLNKAKKFKLLV